MKKRLSIILCVVMMLTLIPTTAFAKTVKAKSVSIAPKSMTLAVDDIAQLSATMKPNNATSKLSWYSSDEDIATVSNKGLVQGKARGTATITVETSNGKTATCSVKVKEYAEKTVESTAVNTTGDIFATIKDRIITLIKTLTYTKSEIDEKIDSSSGGATCDCDSPTELSEINIYPTTSYVMKNVIAQVGQDKSTYKPIFEYPDVALNPLELDNLATITYEEFLNKTDRDFYARQQGYTKYEFDLTITGSVDEKYKNYELFYDFCNESEIYEPLRWENLNEPRINEDGTFNIKLKIKTNRLPKELALSYLYIQYNPEYQ